jgi:uncharacterized RDD family membrane protein YckC
MNPTRVVGRRVVAYVIDIFASFVVIGTIYWFFDHDWYESSSGDITLDPTDTASVYLLVFLFFVVQVALFEGLYGFSFGKLVMQLRVVKSDGHPPGPLRAIVRNLLWIVDGGICGPIVAFLVAVSNSSHKRIGDFVAGTYVIDAVYYGRRIEHRGEGPQVGARTIRPEDLGVSRSELQQFVALRPKDPTYDKRYDTYVMWNEKQNRLLKFDKKTESWVPAE